MAQAIDALGKITTSGLLRASQGAGGSTNVSNSASHSFTNGSAATANSNLQAAIANTTAYDAWQAAAEYNAQEAEKQRQWQEHMANTQYQRAVQDMIKAGINPILAASYGISGAGVGSGATASMSSPEVFMGHSYADTTSASSAHSEGNSWNESESGVATALNQMSSLLDNAINTYNSAQATQAALGALKKEEKNSKKSEWATDLIKELENMPLLPQYGAPVYAW